MLFDLPEGVLETATALLDSGFCTLHVLHDGAPLRLIAKVFCGPHTALVELKNSHTNIVRIEKDGALLFRAEDEARTSDCMTDHSGLTTTGQCKFPIPRRGRCPLRSRWRLCRLTDAAYPLRAHRPVANGIDKHVGIRFRSQGHSLRRPTMESQAGRRSEKGEE